MSEVVAIDLRCKLSEQKKLAERLRKIWEGLGEGIAMWSRDDWVHINIGSFTQSEGPLKALSQSLEYSIQVSIDRCVKYYQSIESTCQRHEDVISVKQAVYDLDDDEGAAPKWAIVQLDPDIQINIPGVFEKDYEEVLGEKYSEGPDYT